MRFLIALLSLSSIWGFSQCENIEISNLQPKSQDFVFPLISCEEESLVADKINMFLQFSELENIPQSRENPFKLAATATNSYSNYVYFYDWEKLRAPSNFLTLKLEGEANGAYPENFTQWKNFDLRTGNYINIEDLFTEKGVEELGKTVNDKVAERIKNFLDELEIVVPNNEDEESTIREQESLYIDCLESNDTYTLKYVDFYFEGDYIVFVRGRCSNHAMRALDDLDSHHIGIHYLEFEQFLTTYGRNIFNSLSEEIVAQPTIQNRLYKGKINGQYPITFLVNEIHEDQSFGAVYWYDKYKKPIFLDGKKKGTHLSMIENDYYDENLRKWIPEALIEADVNGNKIIGTWQDYQTKKKLNLELEEL